MTVILCKREACKREVCKREVCKTGGQNNGLLLPAQVMYSENESSTDPGRLQPTWMVYLHTPSVFHSLMVWSRAPDTICRLSAEKATLITSFVWPTNRRVVMPLYVCVCVCVCVCVLCMCGMYMHVHAVGGWERRRKCY